MLIFYLYLYLYLCLICVQSFHIVKFRHPFLSGKHSKNSEWQIEEGNKFSKLGKLKRLIPFLPQKPPGTLILVRHGESEWNSNKTFTGWVDVDLSERGRIEIQHAARLLLERGYFVDVIYTSRLKRAIRSTWILLKELNQIYKKVYKSWRLNERMYGSLEGLSKPQLAKELGQEVVQQWRSGLLAQPPPMDKDNMYFSWKGKKIFRLVRISDPFDGITTGKYF